MDEMNERVVPPELEELSSPGLSGLVFLGRMGCTELIELDIDTIAGADGSVGVPVDQLSAVISGLDDGSGTHDMILWINPTETEPKPRSEFAEGRIVFDRENCAVLVDGTDIRLTKKEYMMLDFLASNCGTFMERQAIEEACWGDSYRRWTSLRAYVMRLRNRLGELSGTIQTKRNFGYRFYDTPDPDE